MSTIVPATARSRRVDRAAAEQRLTPVGNIDAAEARRLRVAGASMVAAKPSRLLIDLRAVTQLDAAGLAAVTHTALAARRADIEWRVLPPRAQAAGRVLTLTGVGRLLDMAGADR